MQRAQYDLTHFSAKAMQIGRAQCLTIIPVEAGASIEMTIEGVARLASPRQYIVSDCQLTTAAFEVPLRTIWGQPFIDFIKAGPGGAPFAPTPINIAADYRNASYLCHPITGATINSALVQAYNRIIYNYYSVPSFPVNADAPANAQTNFNWFPTTEVGADNCRNYGRLTARLPHVLNSMNLVNASGLPGWEAQSLTDADQEVPVDTVAGTFNLTDMAKIQGRYRSKVSAAWFSHFYQDVMPERFGTHVGPDTDPSNLRPRLLNVERQWLSGWDVDGTDDATLGTYQGKTLAPYRFNLRRKLFDEHALLFVIAVPRYPLVHADEVHPLIKKTSFTYDELAGDADVVGQTKPETFDPQPWLDSTSTYIPTPTVQQPYGQHYRFQNNTVHPNFKKIPGFPYSKWNGSDPYQWLYYQDEEYSDTFETPQVGHAQIHSKIICNKFARIPGITSSIKAGT